jgi:tetratricopeptide (TPR) repeat protein
MLLQFPRTHSQLVTYAATKRFAPSILAFAVLVMLGTVFAGRALPEYTAAEAPKHIGEKATVVGKVGCIDAGRTYHMLSLDGCTPTSPFWIIVNDNASGPDLNIQDLKGVIIAVTGKIEVQDTQPWLVVKSTTQIQPRTSLNTDYISRAHQKEAEGDLDGAIELFGRAIEHQPDRRNEAYEFRGRAKERKADWNGALADYDSLVALDPNNANSYYIRATQKKQHGDFEGAMADFTRAAELRSDPAGFTSIGDMRKERGDITGAAAEYDKAIELCDRQIAGTAKSDPRSPLGSDPYFSRGCARELKGDLDGAVADYTHAIANNPARAAMAYGARGNIRRARGDLNGAIADYQHKYQITHYPDDKQKLEQARAEAKAGAKKLAITQPTAQSAQNEQSFNKSEVSPESLAEAFVQAYSGADVDVLAGLYADRVDHTNSGVISNAALRAQAEKYFTRWPVRHWSLVGPVNTVSLGTSKKKVIFSATYDVSDPQTNKHTSGIAKETLILATDPSGAMKIVSQKEQLSKGNRSQSNDQTSDVPGLEAAKAEYQSSSHDETARVRYVTKLADMSAQLIPKILHNPDVDAKVAYANQEGAIEQELRKHPMPRNVDSRKLSQLVIGNWDSPRHTYVFRADGTYGVSDEQRDKWRIDGNEYVDDVSRGPIILLDRNYFIYACGQGVIFYMRANDSEAERK